MANGTSAGSVFVDLRLNSADFDRDFNAAQARAKIMADKLASNLEVAKQKVSQAQLNYANGTGTRKDILNAQREQMYYQSQIVNLNNRLYSESTRVKGANDVATARLNASLSAEITRQKELESQIKKTSTARSESLKVMAIAATAAGAMYLKDATMKAVNSTEVDNYFEVSMGANIDKATKKIDELNTKFGVNKIEAKNYMASLYGSSKSLGMTSDEAYNLSETLTKLTFDWVSLKNIKPEEAFLKIRTVISGESEPLKDWGINIQEDTVKSYAYANGIAKVGAELTNLQKLQSRMGIVMKGSSNANGDLERTIGSPANQMRKLQAQAEQTATNIGTKFIPTLQKALEGIDNLNKKFDEIPAPVKDTGVSVLFAGAALWGFTKAFSGLAKVITTVKGGLGGLKTAITGLGTGTLFSAGIGSGLLRIIPVIGQIITVLGVAKSALESFNSVKSYNKDAEVFKIPWSNENERGYVKTGFMSYRQETTAEYQARIEMLRQVNNKIDELDKERSDKFTKNERENIKAQLIAEYQKNTDPEVQKHNKSMEEQKAKEDAENLRNAELEKQQKLNAVYKEADEAIYKSSHNAYENKLYDLEQEIKEFQKKEIDKTKIAQYESAKRAEIEKEHQLALADIYKDAREGVFKNQFANDDINTGYYDLTKQYVEKVKKLYDIDKNADISPLTEEFMSNRLKFVRDNEKKLTETIKTENQKRLDIEKNYQDERKNAISGAYGSVITEVQNALENGASSDIISRIVSEGMKKADRQKELSQEAFNIVAGSAGSMGVARQKFDSTELDKATKQMKELGSVGMVDGQAVANNFFLPWEQKISNLPALLANAINGTKIPDLRLNVSSNQRPNISVSVTMDNKISEKVDVSQVADEVAGKIIDELDNQGVSY